jgi:hypothetical protein
VFTQAASLAEEGVDDKAFFLILAKLNNGRASEPYACAALVAVFGIDSIRRELLLAGDKDAWALSDND